MNKTGVLSTEGPGYFLPTKSLWTLAAPPGHKLVFKILVLRTNIGRCEAKLDVRMTELPMF